MLILFDFDGTLVDLEDLQNDAYDAILPLHGINFDMRTLPPGVPITAKIQMFQDMGYRVDGEALKKNRDDWVVDNIHKYLQYSEDLHTVIKTLSQDHILCIATNAGKRYVEKACAILEIGKYISKINTIDSFPPKPDPSMFLDCINEYNMESIIYEDSMTGIQAALQTSSIVEKVRCQSDTIEKLKRRYDI